MFQMKLAYDRNGIVKYQLKGLLKELCLSNLLLFVTIPLFEQSSILAWRIPWTREPGGLLSIGSHRVGHD